MDDRSHGAASMSEQDRKFYKQKMKKLKEALDRGDKAAAEMYANQIRAYFNVDQ